MYFILSALVFQITVPSSTYVLDTQVDEIVSCDGYSPPSLRP